MRRKFITKLILSLLSLAIVKACMRMGIKIRQRVLDVKTLKGRFLYYRQLRCLLKGAVPGKLLICYQTQGYPPQSHGGIGTWVQHLAIQLAALGHHVHVLTRGQGSNTVTLEDGVFVHRIVPLHNWRHKKSLPIDLPDSIFDYTCSMHQIVKKINQFVRIDIVSVPIWDHEGAACLLDPELNAVLSLHTTFNLMAESHSEWFDNLEFRHNFTDKMIAAEYYFLNHARFVQFNSLAMLQIIEDKYNITIPKGRREIVYHGINDIASQYESDLHSDSIEILFVGRLEKRKGIDILLKCVPNICQQFANVYFTIVGDDSLLNEQGVTYKEEFMRTHSDLIDTNKVCFIGMVADKQLQQHYANCDIFVAPSRFESFGLIFIEAMMYAKPVIGCRAGGMVEVIAEGVNGLLAEPSDDKSLYAAICELILDREKRRIFGLASRELFLKKFTNEAMANNILSYYNKVLKTKN